MNIPNRPLGAEPNAAQNLAESPQNDDGARKTLLVRDALELVRQRGAAVFEPAVQQVIERPPAVPLAARAVMGLGIWIGAGMVATILKIVDELLRASSVRAAVGVLFLVFAAWVSRRETWGDVRVHFTILAVVLGEICIVSVLPHDETKLLAAMVVLQAAVVVIVKNPLTRFTSTGLSMFWLLLLIIRMVRSDGASGAWSDLYMVSATALTALVWLYRDRLLASPLATLTQPVAFGLAVGTFGVGATHVLMQAERSRLEIYAHPWAVALALAGVLTLTVASLSRHLSRRDGANRVREVCLLAGVGAFVLAALTHRSPDLMLAPIFLVLGYARREKALQLLGIAALVGGLVALYFQTSGSLMARSGALLAVALLLLAARLVVLAKFGGDARAKPTTDEHIGASHAMSVAVAAGSWSKRTPSVTPWSHRIVVAVAVLMAVGVPLSMAAAKERVKQEGRMVLLPLLPADPRSLMQGDYMTLRYDFRKDRNLHGDQGLFQTGTLDAATIATWPRDGFVVVTLDDHNVAIDVQATMTDARLSLRPNQVKLRYRHRHDQLLIGAETYFFEEGRAPLFAAARFGELRVNEAGEVVLVGLRDAQRATLIAPD